MYYAMAEDRILPPILKRLIPARRYRSLPSAYHRSHLNICVLLGTFEKIVSYVMFIDSISLTTVAASLFILRKRAGQTATPYQGFKYLFTR
jgi:APA family basic amino acid/polyamine antiporter